MCGGQGIHTKELKCQAESFFSRLKGRAFSELTLAKMAPMEKALSTKESGGWETRGENVGPGLPVSFLPTQAQAWASLLQIELPRKLYPYKLEGGPVPRPLPQ